MKIGYARVSTNDQDTAMQRSALERAGCEVIHEEYASGGRIDRPVLWSLLSSLRPGDQVVIYKLDRVARSLSDLLRILDTIERAGGGIQSLTEPIDTTTPTGRLMLQILGAIAEFERSLIRERTLAGMREAARHGRTRVVDQQAMARAVADYLAGGSTYAAVAARHGLSTSSLFAYVKAARR
ncbi:recombinase family protein [Vandammella animalimorsus]|uniref:Recombinase family protein n=1 Tax=Vandammella animalimorsus TaxID=2029117 RepID=A0A3M6R2U1_9BURK|nr:recombinase family protein [Vandammella animalimorsus]RMX09051.1 recombinase family protein [Vandammella animalimorsus]RMX09052.1 recombinase family protein [Vandammella animalimorsus]